MKRLLVRRTSDKERGKRTDQRRQVTETRKKTHTPMFELMCFHHQADEGGGVEGWGGGEEIYN